MAALVPGGASNTVDAPVGGGPAVRFVQIFGER